MNHLNVLRQPWAIHPDRLSALHEFFHGAPGALAAKPANALSAQANPVLSVTDGVAVIPITGIIGKRMTTLMQWMGGTCTDTVSTLFGAAMAEKSVQGIVLLIDSPGGSVDGTQALAAQILQQRGTKPIIAVADGCMCSAAYWIGSAADQIFATSQTAEIGSIGVVAAHVDTSGREAQLGVRVSEIVAGKYKRIASSHGPLTAEGRDSIQGQVDYLYGLFVQHVAAARRTPEQRVISNMADGRVFIGQQAMGAGLIDGIQSLDNVIQGVKKMQPLTSFTRANATADTASTRDELHARAKAYHAKHPGISYQEAVKAVSMQSAAPGDARHDLHSRAKAYQAEHPGTDYLVAINAVSA